MRILLVSPKGDGLWFAMLMAKEGHQVDTYVHDEQYKGTFEGLIPPPLNKLPSAGTYDLIVFDSDSMGEAADEAAKLAPTVGGSSLADRLEEDRLFGLEIMEQAGIKVPAWEAFDSPEKGIAWLQKTHKRTVFKPIGDVPGDDKSTTYVSKGEADMIAFMEKVFTKAKIKAFVLQEVVAGGTEAAVGGWFNGSDWVAVDHNIEEKKLMPGGIGPNTGCAAMLMWMPPRPTPMFQQGLDKIKPFLEREGYRGPLDLNTIVTEGTAYGIEWTPRFGYEGTCNFTRLLPVDFSDFLAGVARGEGVVLANPRSKFAATIRVSVPPYPNADKTRKRFIVPVNGINLGHIEEFFLADVRMGEDGLETLGVYNSVGAPIGLGDSIDDAFGQCEAMIKQLTIPDMMWRNDVCKCVKGRYETLERQGWLRPLG